MFQLNKQQEYIVNEAIKWYNHSSEQVFQFAGYAGTGKSVVLSEIRRRLGIPLERTAPMAYIGQASIVMRLKGFHNAKTIHSQLFTPVEKYEIDKNGEIVIDKYLNKPKTKIYFEPKDLSNIDLIFIDEAGSVPYSLKHEIESRGIKIVATGDLGQLPPVADKPAYLYSGKVYILDEIMRQKSDSGLLYLANRARKGLPIHTGYYKDCMVIYDTDLNDYMISKSDIIICSTNKSRDMYNNHIRRNILRYNTNIPQARERVVCRKNNWTIESNGINLANGLICEVINNPDVSQFNGKTFKMNLCPTLSKDSVFKDIECDYEYFIADHKQRNILKSSKYGVGEKFEFAYSITTHSSQGSQFRNGIYIEESFDKSIENNLNYTGITRFMNSCIYVVPKKKLY